MREHEYFVRLTFGHGGHIIESIFASDDEDARSQFDEMYMRLHGTGRLHVGDDLLERFGVFNPEYVGVELMELASGQGVLLSSLGVLSNV